MRTRTVIQIDEDQCMTLLESYDIAIENPTKAPCHAAIEAGEWQVLRCVDGALRVRWKDQETYLSTSGRSGRLVLRTPESQRNSDIGVRNSLVFSNGSVARRELIRATFLSKDAEGHKKVISRNYAG